MENKCNISILCYYRMSKLFFITVIKISNLYHKTQYLENQRIKKSMIG